MKRIPGFLSASMTHLFAWVALVVCMFVSTPAFARLKVKRVTPSGAISLGGGNRADRIFLYCQGYDTYITRDENGKTQVYVYDDGTRHSSVNDNWSNDEKYRVDIESEGYNWNYAVIYIGKEGSGTSSSYVSCNEDIHVKMDGGHVGEIIFLGSGSYNETKDVYFWATGGAIALIKANGSSPHIGSSRGGNSYISLSNVKYYGGEQMYLSGHYANTYLFINTDCEFFHPGARFSSETDDGFGGIIAPDPSNMNNLFARNAARIESGFEAKCDEFVDSSSSLNISGKLYLNKCGGWKSSKDIADYPNVILSHKHYQHITKPATCTEAAEYISKCLVCNKELPPTIDVAPLGHHSVANPTEKIVCFKRSGGTHCGRCATTLKEDSYGRQLVDSKNRKSLSPQMRRSTCFKDFSTGVVTALGYAPCVICGETVLFYGNRYEMEPGHYFKIAHNFVDIDESRLKSIIGADAKYVNAIQPTCTQIGRKYQYCKDCGWIKSVPVERTRHKFTSVVGRIEPTCTMEGRAAYKQCENCHQCFLTDASPYCRNGVSLSDLAIPAKGHVYSTSLGNNLAYRLNEADCTKAALYGSACTECGEVSEFYTCEGEPARGHQYHIDHIDCLNPDVPYEGDLTLKCADCGKLNKDLAFCLVGNYGAADGVNADGYWCKSVIVGVDTLPTCINGYGTYQVSVKYRGTLSRATYKNFIPASEKLHNYGADGICHEQHFLQSGVDEKGMIIYRSGPIVDNTVYRTNGYVVIPRQVPYEKLITFYTETFADPEDGSVMTYTDYDVIQYDDRSSQESALRNVTTPHYTGILGDCALNDSYVLTDPNCLGVICHGGALNYTLTDATAYGATSDFNLEQFTYNRSFTNTLWQPLYVPFSVSVEELEAEGLQVARLNDTHMYDNDFDGDIDSVTVEFIRFTQGTLQANRPYMVRSTSGNNTLRLNKENVALSKAVDNSIECSTVDQVISIVGTYSGLGTGVMYNNNYYALNAQGGLSRAASTAATLKPQRWYMKVENKDGSPIATGDYFAASIRVMGEWGDEEVTGIEELVTETEAEGERQVYSLDGMRVTDGKQLQRGVYVDNGRRIVVH